MDFEDRTPAQKKFFERTLGKHRFTVQGDTFVATHVPPLKLIGIARRLAPFVRSFTSMSVAFEAMSTADRTTAKDGDGPAISRAEALDRVVSGVSPVLTALAEMSEPDQDYIISNCLGVTVRVESVPRPTPLLRDDGKPLDGLSAGEILGVTAEVLNWELPALWAEIQQLGGLFQGIVTSATAVQEPT